MNYQEHANALRDSADALEDAQRALNHLDGLLEAWDAMTDSDRRMAVLAAVQRLDGTWSTGNRERALT